MVAYLTEAYINPIGRKIFFNDALEIYFKELKRMVSSDALLNYPDCKILFIVHNDASDKQVGAVISQNDKSITFLSIRLSKPQRNYTMTEKELLSIVECLKQFRVILFG